MIPEALELFSGTEGGLALYGALEAAILANFSQVELRPRRSQIGFFHGCGFAWAWPARRQAERRAGRIMLSIGLPAPLDSPRILQAVEPYPGRWTHHLSLARAEEIDAELLSWLRDAWHFAALRSRER